MKISTLLSLSTLGLTATLAFSSACDDGGAQECTETADCDDTTLQCVDGLCSVADEPECEEDLDCDLADTEPGSPLYSKDELDAGNDECEDEDAVTIVTFSGEEVCALEAEDAATECSAGESLADAEAAAGGTVTICIKADGTCDEDGQCS